MTTYMSFYWTQVNKIYLVLEYMKKGDLIQYLRERERVRSMSESGALNGKKGKQDNQEMKIPRVDEEELWQIFRQVSAGLRYLHFQNVVHGDIKPQVWWEISCMRPFTLLLLLLLCQNLLVGEDQVVKIADFGISKMLSGSEEKLADATGTPAFMAPELCDGRAEFSGQLADVWALGATMFMLRFGQPPFIAGNIIHLYSKITSEPLVFPFSISPSLQDLLENMLVKDPSKRFTLAQVMKHAWLTVKPIGTIGGPVVLAQSSSSLSPRSSAMLNLSSGQRKLPGFQPPPSYDEEQERAMEGPVHGVNVEDLHASIGFGTQTKARVKKVSAVDSGGSPAAEVIVEVDGEENDMEDNDDEEEDENIMATAWGNDVFDIVEDTDLNSEIGDEEESDSEQSTGRASKVPFSSSESGPKPASVTVCGGTEAEKTHVQMAEDEEAMRSRRFKERVVKKSSAALSNHSSHSLSGLREDRGTSAERFVSGPPGGPVNGGLSRFAPLNVQKRLESSASDSEEEDEADEKSDSASSKGHEGQTSKNITRFSPSNLSATEQKDFPRSMDDDDEEEYLGEEDVGDNTNQLTMEDFERLMDTLAMQPRSKLSGNSQSSLFAATRTASVLFIPSSSIESSKCNVGSGVGGVFSSVQGPRPTQEDKFVYIPNLGKYIRSQRDVPDSGLSHELVQDTNFCDRLKRLTVACVFDGHSGSTCSDFLAKNVISSLVSKRNKHFLLTRRLDLALLQTFKLLDEEVSSDWKTISHRVI